MNRLSSHIFKKNYGQNFLRNGKFVRILSDSLELNSEDTVLEIGPGEGIVTNNLLNSDAKVLSIEIDYSLVPNLIKRFGENSNFELLNEDFLSVNITEALDKIGSGSKVKAAGSLPYNISKKIIKKLLDFNLSQSKYFIERMAFIVQDEVAKEYVAKAPRASFLSNSIRLYANVKKLESIPASQFYPMPKVNGAILLIEPKKNVAENADEIYKFIRLGYSSPRKTLIKNLKNSNKWSKETLENGFNKLGFTLTARAAELEEEAWVKLFKELHTY